MAGSAVVSEPSGFTAQQETTGIRFALVSLISLFFMWGFITSLNDILIPYLKNMFELNYTQAMLIQFCFFGAYFIVSIPAGALVSRIGYQRGIITGLVIASIGCLLFYPAASLRVYPVFLAALFVLASGITILQVAANPYVSVLGSAKTASSRLTLTQAFNSLGTTVAPVLVGPIILAALVVSSDPSQAVVEQASAIQTPYLLLAAALFALAVIFTFIKLPKITNDKDLRVERRQTKSGKSNSLLQSSSSNLSSVLHHRHLVFGVIGIFVYVGAEVGIGSFLVNFIGMDSISGIPEAEASKYIGYYFGGAMVGRFVGAYVMQKIQAGKVLAFNAVCASVLIIVAMVSSGSLAMWSLLMIGLCNSIMFPTIFTLAIAGLKEQSSQGSGILCLAIVGGAILPLLQGMLADMLGIQLAFIIPLACFIYIAHYGLWGSKPTHVPQKSS